MKRIARYCAIALALPFIFSAPANAMTSSWDNGRVWSKIANAVTGYTNGIATSATGQYVYAINLEGVQFSSDEGLTFETRNNGVTNNPGYFSDIATSASGAYVVAVQNGFYVWTSSDYGLNWSRVENIRATPLSTGPTGGYRRVTMSSSGQYIAISNNEGYVLTSGDFGANFTRRVVSSQVSGSYYMNDIEISADGQVVLVNSSLPLGKLYLSTNRGASFQQISDVPLLNWSAVEISGDGNTLLAAEMGGSIWTSRDRAGTWKESLFSGPASHKSWAAASMSYDGQMMAVVRHGKEVVTSASGGEAWEYRSGGASDADYQTVASSSDGLIMYVLASRDGLYKSLPSWITTDAGTVTFSHKCTSDTSTVTSVQAQSVLLIIDTATVANDTNDYHYYTETNTALWGASYDYGSTQNEIDCSYRDMTGSLTLARGPFIASSGPGYSETSVVGQNAEFVQYIGNINPYGAGYFHDNNCGNTTVPNINVANPCDFTNSDKQQEWPRLDTGISMVVRSSFIRSGVSLPTTGVQATRLQAATIFVIVKAKKSVISAAPRNTTWVATETFTVTSA